MTIANAIIVLDHNIEEIPEFWIEQFADEHGVNLFDAELMMIREACDVACKVMREYLKEHVED